MVTMWSRRDQENLPEKAEVINLPILNVARKKKNWIFQFQ